MGWFSSFSSGDSPNKPQDNAAPSSRESSSVALTEEQRMRVFGRPGPQATATATREQQADSELDALIKSFQEDSSVKSPSQQSDPSTPAKHQETIQEQDSTPSRHLSDGTLDISPEAIYPRTMSCRQQFDQAFYCQSLGGKFNDIYRYGHLKSCSEQWSAFWFCMRTRTLPQKEKEDATREFYRKRDERRKNEMGSSEDVWEIRSVALTRAFWRDPDEEGGEGVVVKE